MENIEVLRLLGIEPPFEKTSQEEMQNYIQKKAETRIEDAKSSTSHKKEYKTLYKNGIPPLCIPQQSEILEILSEKE